MGDEPSRHERTTSPIIGTISRRPLARLGSLVTQADAMMRVFHMVDKVAPTEATVLVVGESGTGKELIAEAIHNKSPRRRRQFVAINCGAIPENLIDSELFGHEKGAFTGAGASRAGLFEEADGGTLFLDEITEMPLDLQARLLRVLETNRVRRVGGSCEIPVNYRLVAATNRDPQRAVERGRLRKDLFYRLTVFPVQVPPLRERADDAVALAEHFVDQMNERLGQRKRLTPESAQRIAAYPWPGNVRQLKNAIDRAAIMSEGDRIEVHIQPEPAIAEEGAPGGEPSVEIAVGTSLADAEYELIHATLSHCGGDKKQAAQVLGVSLRTLYNRLSAYRKQTDEDAEPRRSA